jgi:PKD domain
VPNFLRSLSARSIRRPLTLSLAVTAAALAWAAAPAGAVVAGSFGEQQRLKQAVETTVPLQYHEGPVLHSSAVYAVYWDPTGSYNNEWKQLIDGYLQGVGADKGTLHNVFALNGQYRDASGRAANESLYRGSFTAEDPYPTTENCTEPAVLACLTDAQIRTELQKVISSGKPPGASGTPVYYVLTPPGVTVCDGLGAGHCSNSTATPANGICGYHSAINPGGPSPTIYAVQPWVAGNAGSVISQEEPTVTHTPTTDVLACQDNRMFDEPNQLSGHNIFGEWTEGLADVIINDLSIEQSNIATDPLLNGWYQTGSKAEQSDMCQWAFGPPPVKPPSIPEEQVPAHAQIISNASINGRGYYIQWGFDSVGVTAGKGHTCSSGVVLEPHFTAPNPVNSGDVVSFDATESLITLNAHTEGLPTNEPYVAPIYKWEFGDGASVTGTNTASEFHSYAQGGTYNVILTVTDSSGNSNTFAKPITVVGPGGSSSVTVSVGGGAAPTTQSLAGPPSSAATAPKPKPVVAAAAVSRSLRSVLRHGLTVRYSVSEQVVGHFEVLLASSVARRLGLRGPAATGLAPGSAPQIVIGKAILVTTTGGRNTAIIQFSKRTASRLAKLGRVSLLLRLVVRNASNQTVTVIGTVPLSH